MGKKISLLGVVAKTHPRAKSLIKNLVQKAKSKKISLIFESETARWFGLRRADAFDRADGPPPSADAMIVLGGDGTVLSAARMVVSKARPCPLFCVNIGGMGFLTNVPKQKFEKALSAFLNGNYAVEERSMLKATLVRNKKSRPAHHVLNDVVINKGAIARIISMDMFIGDKYVAPVRADGLIIATPTGSTAYILAAGGPIVYPTMDAIVLAPICPHSLAFRPLVIPNLPVSVRLTGRTQDVYLTLDGQTGNPLEEGDIIRVERSERKTYLVRFPWEDYFDLLRTKLRWGVR